MLGSGEDLDSSGVAGVPAPYQFFLRCVLARLWLYSFIPHTSFTLFIRNCVVHHTHVAVFGDILIFLSSSLSMFL